MTPAATTDNNGVWHIHGRYGRYTIDGTDPLAEIDRLIGRLAKGHPDCDALLDARLEIAREVRG